MATYTTLKMPTTMKPRRFNQVIEGTHFWLLFQNGMIHCLKLANQKMEVLYMDEGLPPIFQEGKTYNLSPTAIVHR